MYEHIKKGLCLTCKLNDVYLISKPCMECRECPDICWDCYVGIVEHTSRFECPSCNEDNEPYDQDDELNKNDTFIKQYFELTEYCETLAEDMFEQGISNLKSYVIGRYKLEQDEMKLLFKPLTLVPICIELLERRIHYQRYLDGDFDISDEEGLC